MTERETKVIEAIRRFGRPEPCTMCGTAPAFPFPPPICQRHQELWEKVTKGMLASMRQTFVGEMYGLEKWEEKP